MRRNTTMEDRTSRDPNMYGSGVASLIGASGISLDGQSIQLPGDASYDIQDDVSSIHDSSYWKGNGEPPSKIKIVGTVSSLEEGNMEQLSPASIALSGKSGDDKNAHSAGTSQHKQAPNMTNTSKLSVNGNGGCVPKWVSAAPVWLKLVIAFSTALLVGAVVLVTVALFSALANRPNTTPESNFVTFAPGVVIPPLPSSTANVDILFTSPPAEPTATPIIETESDAHPATSQGIDTENPVIEETGNKPIATDPPTKTPTSAPKKTKPVPATPQPSARPTEAQNIPSPASKPVAQENPAEDSSNGSNMQNQDSEPYDEFVTTFFVTGGRFTNDALAQIPNQLRTLPVRGGTSFLVHLGDWNSPYATRCDEQSYQDVQALFSNSSIPVYFIPGDNDFNDCPNPEQAMSFWHEYLMDYQSRYWEEPSQWALARGAPNNYPENFAFSYNDILFVGINLVGGVVHNATEWETRHEANLDWIDANYEEHKDTMKAFVLFAHADPDVPSNSGFYEPFKQRVKKDYNKVPVVLIHRNLGVEPWSWETEFENINNFSVIVVAGSSWPPLMGAVDFRQERPFIFDQSNWYDEYIEHQKNQ